MARCPTWVRFREKSGSRISGPSGPLMTDSDIGPSPTAAQRALMSWAEFPILGAFLTGERVERRLAAVLAADVAGYSRSWAVMKKAP